MISRPLFYSAILSCFTQAFLGAQTASFPFIETFDTIAAPSLPAGWSTSNCKSPAGDFSTSASTALSAPNAVVSADAKIAQCLTSPAVDFSGKIAGTLEFYERRTASHNSGLLVEAAADGDTSFSTRIGDTLKNTGTTNYILRSLTLPASLSGGRNVRFRWRVVGNGTGATGTLRIDNVKISVQKMLDLAVAGLMIDPAHPRKADTLSVHVRVANRALSGSLSFILRLFDDRDPDSLGPKEIEVGELSLTRFFASADSATFILTDPSILPGCHQISVRLSLPGDEDPTNNTVTEPIVVGYSPRTVLVNEIMYAPSGGPEWIECVNTSIDTLTLSQWKIGDNTAAKGIVNSPLPLVFPRQYFLVARDSSILNFYPSIHAPILKAEIPALNNDADAVVVSDPAGFTMDSVAYNSSWGGTGGRSLERIDTAAPSNQPGNWGSSRNPAGATPGAVNSLTKKEYDLSAGRMFLSPLFPVVGQPFEIAEVVKNCGRQADSNICTQFFLDANSDSLPQTPELRGQKNIPVLLPADSQIVAQSLTIVPQGENRIIVRVKADHDDDSTNNEQSLSFIVGVERRSIVINEIMYAPAGNMPEWIEFYNASGIAIDLSGWKISDANVKSKADLAHSQFIVQPGAYFLAASDSTLGSYFSLPCPVCVTPFSSLNNTSPDAVVLYDNRGVTIDSVWYKPWWGGTNGKSLERIDYLSSSADSANWKSSLPTPGVENISAKKDFDIMISSASAATQEGGLRLAAVVRNAGRNAASGFTVRFYYDANGDSVGSPAEMIQSIVCGALLPADSVVLQYDWKTEAHGMIPIICAVEYSQDQRTLNNTLLVRTAKKFDPQTVVINEIMYDPLPNYSEFVELFNRSADTVDLQNWTILNGASSSARKGAVRLSFTRMLLAPNEYAVICADSLVVRQFPALLGPGKVVVTNKDLSLSNSGGDVVLLDLTNTQIDSVRYSPSWHNPMLNTPTAGKSLERINPALASNDRRNWSSSIAVGGATPGERNSIFTMSVPSGAHLTLSPNPFSPDNDGIDDFLVIKYALPSAISMIRVRCFDVQGRLVRTIANNEPAASTGTILWNGLDDYNRRVRIGLYIILFEALDSSGGIMHTMKDVAVVAAKL